MRRVDYAFAGETPDVEEGYYSNEKNDQDDDFDDY